MLRDILCERVERGFVEILTGLFLVGLYVCDPQRLRDNAVVGAVKPVIEKTVEKIIAERRFLCPFRPPLKHFFHSLALSRYFLCKSRIRIGSL